MRKVLITGASGLIGKRLTEMLLERGYSVNHLGRKNGKTAINPLIASFSWDIDIGELDERAFAGVSAIIHLAGAGVAEKRWTGDRKKEIIDSRIKSAELIIDFLKKGNHNVENFISASAVGYYGDCGNEAVSEERKTGNGFLAEVCTKWEEAAIKIGNFGLREVRCRIGIVLSKEGGALPQLIRTIPFGFANYFYKDPLFYPWIHIDDVCGIMIHAFEHESISGACNTTAPQPLSMKNLMKEILCAKKSNAILLPVPPVAIRLALGEMSEMLLCSQKCSAEKIINSGYRFRFGKIGEALKEIF